jgi:hypothetical protein
MGYGMKYTKGGFPFKSSPAKQDKTNVQLSEHEKKQGTMVTSGSKNEEINDLEDRLEFLNSDLGGGGKEDLKIMEKGKIISQKNKLKAQLKKLRGE